MLCNTRFFHTGLYWCKYAKRTLPYLFRIVGVSNAHTYHTRRRMLISSYGGSTHNTLFSMSDVHRLALHIFIVSVITSILDPPHVRVTTDSVIFRPWTEIKVWKTLFFVCDLVQFDRSGTTQNLGRIVPEVGADRPRLGRTWGGSTRGGSTLGRIICKPLIDTGFHKFWWILWILWISIFRPTLVEMFNSVHLTDILPPPQFMFCIALHA